MKKFISLILLSITLCLQAQVNIDSLVNVLETKELTEDQQVDLYWDISRFYVNYDYDKCIQYAKGGLTLAEKINNERRIMTFNNVIGISYYHKSSFDTSYIYLNRYLEMAVKSGTKELQISAYNNLGNLYKLKQDYPKAVEYYIKSLEVDTLISSRADALVNLGVVHRMLHHWDRAIEYIEQALVVADQLNLSYIKMGASHTLGTIYSDKQEYDKAIECYKKSLELSLEGQNKLYELISLQSLSVSYSTKKEYQTALEYAFNAKQIADEIGTPKSVIGSRITLSEIYRELKQYKDSEETAMEAWKGDSTSITEGSFAAFNLAIANVHLGNKQSAEYFIHAYRDIVFKGDNKQMKETLAEMEVKYESEKKKIRIAALERERTLYIWLGLVITVALLSIIGLLFYRHRLATQNRKIVEQQVKQLEQEKELIAIQSSLKAEKAERDLIAHDLHDSVSSLLTVAKNNMSLYLASEHKETDYFSNAFEVLSKSITELRRVVYHLKSFILTKEGLAAALDDFCRFIPHAEFHFRGLNRRFNPDKEYVLYDCACELINNALKHSGASRIEVHLNMDEQTVYLSVADNGTGFDACEIMPGIGLDNIRSNLSAFGGHLDILSEPDKGTEANIELEV